MISLWFSSYRHVFLYNDRMDSIARHLAQCVRDRRAHLALTQEEAADRSANGVSTPNWRAIEAGKRSSVAAATAAGLERALWWKEGSVKAILAGGEPSVDPDRPLPSYVGDVVDESELPKGGHYLSTNEEIDREFGHFLSVMAGATQGIAHSHDMAKVMIAGGNYKVYVKFDAPRFSFHFETPDWDEVDYPELDGLASANEQFAVAADTGEPGPAPTEFQHRPHPPAEDED